MMTISYAFRTLLLIVIGYWTTATGETKKDKFTVTDLMITNFPSKLSSDIDMDPCKSGAFSGDIALPNVNYDLELKMKKLNASFEESIEKWKKEIFLEGLQIEEEGLLDVYKAKQKHDAKLKENHLKTTKRSHEEPLNYKLKEDDTTKETIEKPLAKFNISQIKSVKNLGRPIQPSTLKLKSVRNKVINADDEFEQVEPKYFPKPEDFEETQKYYSAKEDETDRKLKIQVERRRRIQHTGDPLTLEILEMKKMKKMQNSTIRLKSNGNAKANLNSEINRLEMAEEEDDNDNGVKLKSEFQSGPEYFKLFKKEEEITKGQEVINPQDKSNKGRKRGGWRKNENNCSHQKSKKQRMLKPNRKKKNNQEERKQLVRNLNINDNTTEGTYSPETKRGRNGEKRCFNSRLKTTVKKDREAKQKQRKIDKNDHELEENGKLNETSRFRDFPITINHGNESQRRATRAATARKERVWDYGVIPYEIDGNFSGGHKALFKQAMRHWENFTCVRFVERSQHEHPNYIVFTERPCGCCSFVGKRGNGPQAISIGKNCDKFGIVVHELGHVVGFWHEHTRPDRDNHVQIVRENIMGGQEYNFNKLNEEEVNSLGLPYDYDSIMHYARNTFSKGTYLDTIQPLDKAGVHKRPEIGQRIRLSEGDIAQTNLVYKCHKCGRTFQENSASFSSPNYGNITYTAGLDKCEWRITATHGEKIALNITDLDIYKSDGCRTDYLEIRDGYWHKSPSLAKLCGKRKVPDLIMSTGSRLLITYTITTKSSGHRGFSAKYEAICGGEINLDTEVGHLESPNFPEDYQPNKECIWKLNAPERFQIALKFQSFEVENHDNCVYDYVEIRDGHDLDSKVLGTFCGYKIPDDIRSTSNKLLVKFVSDGSVQKAGFSASFMIEFDECMFEYHGCEHKCVNTWGSYECQCKIGYELHSDGKHCEDACGGILSTSNGTITSPSFPEIYPGNKKCIWEIVAPLQYKITLNFTHFDLEGNNIYQQECEYDKVEVHSKMSNDILRGHGVFCGSRIPPLITSESNSLRVEFTSDYTVQKSGFAAVFFTDMDECATDNGGCQHECQNTIGSYVCACHNGFILHENGHDCKEGGCKYHITIPNGQLQSPNFPDYYPSKKDCVWQLITTPGHRIKLIFSEFEIEPHQECAYDHIVLYDGDSPDAHTLGRFCGSKIPHNIIATGNQMYMVFKSDASVQRRGFLASHTTVCGGHLQATSRVKHFYSHAKYGDHNYDDRADCDWSIEAAPGKNVHLTFLTFEVEDETDCGYDFVEVFNGLDDSGASYGKFCGSSNPTDIFSVTEALVVRFRTDDTINFKGFSAAYVAVDPKESV